ncbi:MAG: PP2C family protein-serine/threonine phosphatase [Phycisphaerales bacterium]
MGQQIITLAGSSSCAEATERCGRAVVERWPRYGRAPQVRDLPLERVEARLRTAEGARELAGGGPMLLVLGPEVAGARLYQLVDRIQQEMLPAVLLLPEVDDTARRLQAGGLIVEGHDADPGVLGAVLFALSERQATVRSLERDLAIAARYEGGVRGEIDRIHDELNLAAAVQKELLPRGLPALNGLEFGVLFRPASYVSGDIYDVMQLDERHVGFFIADAVGHGVPAALMTMVISRSLRMTRAGEKGREIVLPGEAMTRLNDELCRGTGENPRFSTAVYGIIDSATRRVTLAGAGHPPPLRIHGRRLTRVETEGPLLGVFAGERYNDTSFTMTEDETLLLYSDGFETAFAPSTPPEKGKHQRRSSDAYLGELASLRWPGAAGGSASEALLELAVRLDEQAGSLHQIDDVTAVAICGRGTAWAGRAGRAAA